MIPASIALAAVAIALAGPVPILLSRARWTRRAPGTALALWQAIALGGGLSMIGSLLGFGLAGFGPDLAGALSALAAAGATGPVPGSFGIIHIALLSLAALLTLDLVLNLIDTAVRTELERRRHRELVAILSAPSHDLPATRVLDHPAPVAYCLPGVRSMTVLSNGLIGMLSPAELRAVLAHEDSHLRQYHHLVLLAFKAWRKALPWFPIATRAERSVALLVEFLADDRALRVVDRATLAAAIDRVGSAWDAPEASGGSRRAGGVDAGAITLRLERLSGPPRPLNPLARAGILTVAGALAAFPAGFLVVLA